MVLKVGDKVARSYCPNEEEKPTGVIIEVITTTIGDENNREYKIKWDSKFNMLNLRTICNKRYITESKTCDSVNIKATARKNLKVTNQRIKRNNKGCCDNEAKNHVISSNDPEHVDYITAYLKQNNDKENEQVMNNKFLHLLFFVVHHHYLHRSLYITMF